MASVINSTCRRLPRRCTTVFGAPEHATQATQANTRAQVVRLCTVLHRCDAQNISSGEQFNSNSSSNGISNSGPSSQWGVHSAKRHCHHHHRHNHHQQQQAPPHTQLQQQHRSGGSNSNTTSSINSSGHQRPLVASAAVVAGTAPPICVTASSISCCPSYVTHSVEEIRDNMSVNNITTGKRQSPVALMSMNASYRRLNEPLQFNYPKVLNNLKLSNTGLFWQVKLPYVVSMQSILQGAHLGVGRRYKLDQFHCHWGPSDTCDGSEHTVDNRAYAAELHFVHFNIDKYHSCGKAARAPDGIAVVAVFLDASPEYTAHAELEKISSALTRVPTKASNYAMRHAIRVDNLLPANRSYWTYEGSLTTEPFYESVTWFVLKNPIKCNSAQVAKFRNLEKGLYSGEAPPIVSNHRDTQPLYGRTISTFDETPTKQTKQQQQQ